jgi:hypothetical protein
MKKETPIYWNQISIGKLEKLNSLAKEMQMNDLPDDLLEQIKRLERCTSITLFKKNNGKLHKGRVD